MNHTAILDPMEQAWQDLKLRYPNDPMRRFHEFERMYPERTASILHSLIRSISGRDIEIASAPK